MNHFQWVLNFNSGENFDENQYICIISKLSLTHNLLVAREEKQTTYTVEKLDNTSMGHQN